MFFNRFRPCVRMRKHALAGQNTPHMLVSYGNPVICDGTRHQKCYKHKWRNIASEDITIIINSWTQCRFAMLSYSYLNGWSNYSFFVTGFLLPFFFVHKMFFNGQELVLSFLVSLFHVVISACICNAVNVEKRPSDVT